MNQRLPMFGRARARVTHVTSVSIHGDIYYDIIADLSPAPGGDTGNGESTGPATIRLPAHLCPEPPRPGQTLELAFLMGQVNAVTPVHE
jgi:hypothetical protein